MPMKHITRCDCGNQNVRIIQDWESYDTPYRIPLGWRYGTRPLDAAICPECQKKKEVVS